MRRFRSSSQPRISLGTDFRLILINFDLFLHLVPIFEYFATKLGGLLQNGHSDQIQDETANPKNRPGHFLNDFREQKLRYLEQIFCQSILIHQFRCPRLFSL